MRHNVYLTPFVSSVMPVRMVGDLFQFLMTQRQYVLSPSETTQLFKTRSFGGGYIADIVSRIVESNHQTAYGLLRLPSKTMGLREAADMSFLPIDTLQMKAVDSHAGGLVVPPELLNKLVVNISGLTRVSGELSNVEQFHARVVRDFLSRNYYLAPGDIWLSPLLVRYVARVYSMTIGAKIARLFGLSDAIQQFNQTVFCAFYVGLMCNPDVAPAFLRVSGREMGIGDPNEVMQITGFIQETLGHPIPKTLEEVCQVIEAYDHGQIRSNRGSRLTRAVLNMNASSLHADGQISMIALEYPPFFLFMILQALSGGRSGLSVSMKKMNLMNKGKEAVEQVLRQPSLFSSLSV